MVPVFNSLLCVSAGVSLMACLPLVMLLKSGKVRSPYKEFGIFSLLVCVFSFLMFLTYSRSITSDSPLSLTASITLFSNLSLLAEASFVSGIMYLSAQKKAWLYTAAIFTTASIIIISQFAMGHPVRFESVLGLITYTAPWGESIQLPNAVESPLNIPRTLIDLVAGGYIVWRSVVLRRNGQKLESNFITSFVVLFVGLTALDAYLFEQGYIFFLSIFTALFAVVCLFIYLTINLVMVREEVEQLADNLNLSKEERKHYEDSFQLYLSTFLLNPAPQFLLSSTGKTIGYNNASAKLFDLKRGQSPNFDLLAVLTENGMKRMHYTSAVLHKVDVISPPFNLNIQGNERLYEAHIYPLQLKADKASVVIQLNDITADTILNNGVRSLASGISSKNGGDYFNDFVLNLQKVTSGDFIMFGLYDGLKRPTRARVKAVAADGRISQRYNFNIAKTPFEAILHNGKVVYKENLQADFSSDTILVEMGAESFIGCAIKNKEGRHVGFLAYIKRTPLIDSQPYDQIVEVYASNIGLELERVEAEERLKHFAYEDYLTRLPNRFHCQDVIEAFVRSDNREKQLLVILFDIDHFKKVNDSLGHEYGDLLLRLIGQRLGNTFDSTFFVSRFGGDEFIILHEYEGSAGEEMLHMLCKRLLDIFADPFEISAHEIRLPISIGAASIPQHASSLLDTLRVVEVAIQNAKDKGRNSYVIYDVTQGELSQRKGIIETALRYAVTSNVLKSYFQPQVNSSGHIVGAELLLRWNDPELGFISPGEFIPIAEESGLIYDVSEWVVDDAFRFAHENRALLIKSGCSVSINISAWSFERREFAELLIDKVTRLGIDPKFITLELTETSLLTDVQTTIEKLNRLRKVGFKIALDDFGTGYSSLAYLRDLPLDELKIDKAFIIQIDESNNSSIVDSIISIARNMDYIVVAEGVETPTQLEKLKQKNCHRFQGFHFYKPMPEADFIRELITMKESA
tara:strand:- start:5619 stop:8534 length:2916 start_codon:yes stop_codon:yes gene_type:complete